MTRSQRRERVVVAANWSAALLLTLGLASGCTLSSFDSVEGTRRESVTTDALGDPAVPPRSSLDVETTGVLNRLLPANALPGQFVIQQSVTVRWMAAEGPEEATFDAALQRRGDSLLLLGFGPMKQVGFELLLEDGRVRFENRTGRKVPFRPEDILADVQRVFYPWIESGGDCTECERRGRRLALDVEERIGKALLEERRFRFHERPELGVVLIRYSGDRLFGVVPTECDVSNEWFGYRLEIRSHRMDRIDEAASGH
jgi:hypothetical protein